MVPTPKDNANGQLDATVLVTDTNILVKSGEGANFPQPITASATSAGDATTLNSTGIQAAGVVVGALIFNLTDSTPASDTWAVAVVRTVSTNSVTTSPLFGGTSNLWNNSDVWVVSPFTIELSKRTGGVITGTKTHNEKVLITSRSTDTLSIPTTSGYRGFDGTSVQEFASNDFVTIEVDQSYFDGLKAIISLIYRNFPTNTEACLVTGNQTVAGVKTFSSFPVTPSSAPTTNYQAANKKYVDDEIVAAAAPYPKPVYTSGSTTLTGASSNTITHSLTVNQTDVENGKYSILVSGNDSNSEGATWSSDDSGISGIGQVSGAHLTHQWNAGTPSNANDLYWTASTVKIYATGTITNAIVQVFQNYA